MPLNITGSRLVSINRPPSKPTNIKCAETRCRRRSYAQYQKNRLSEFIGTPSYYTWKNVHPWGSPRLALGLKVTRVVTKMGIEAFRMPFQGDGPGRRWVLDNIGEEVTVYVDPHSIEEVTLKTADGQTFYFKSSLSQFKDFTLQEWVHFLEEWRASDPLSKSISVEALHRFYKRIDAENDKLLDFYGKEHKVIKLDDAQTLCDGLAGNDLSILPYEGGSNAASPEDIYRGDEEGEGIFVPGGVVIEEAEIIEDIPPAREPKSKPTRTFTGAAKGKGVLK